MEEYDLTLGIDDAGRGPLVGPMSLAGCLVTKELEAEFKKLGVRDSKTLTDKKREELAEEIRKKAVSFFVNLTYPSEIDSRNAVGLNLNKIEAIKSAEIVNNLTKNVDKKIKVIIDCPSPNKTAWKAYLLRHIDRKDLNILCEHKADRDYVACSAASVLAKSEREKQVAILKEKLGIDFGSGYTSDSLTIEFLKNFSKQFKKDGIFRETWATFQDFKKEKEQKRLGEY